MNAHIMNSFPFPVDFTLISSSEWMKADIWQNYFFIVSGSTVDIFVIGRSGVLGLLWGKEFPETPMG